MQKKSLFSVDLRRSYNILIRLIIHNFFLSTVNKTKDVRNVFFTMKLNFQCLLYFLRRLHLLVRNILF
jgi:hypothetical protein